MHIPDITLIGINHNSATVELREKFALPDEPRIFLNTIDDLLDISEIAIISTCNRVEIITVSYGQEMSDKVIKAWAQASGETEDCLKNCVYIYKGQKAIEHLFTVTASLDSQVLGEPQILGQVKNAYKKAVKAGTSKVILNNLFHRSFYTAKKVRTQTKVAHNAISVGFVAVELAKKTNMPMDTCTIMLVGAGEMAELAAVHLKESGFKKFIVANRTASKAQKIADMLCGRVIELSSIQDALSDTNIVISSASVVQPLITEQQVKKALADSNKKSFELTMIDLGLPRNIDKLVRFLPGVSLYDLDDLEAVVHKNRELRSLEAEKGKIIVNKESHAFMDWMGVLNLKPTIVDLFDYTNAIAEHELKKTLRRIGPLSKDTEMAIATMLNAVVKKINHEPVTFIKRFQKKHGNAMHYVDILRKFYNLDEKK